MANAINCPPPEKWRDYVRDRLSPAEDAALTEHVQTCPGCTERLAALVPPSPSPRTPPAPAGAPPDLIDRLRRLWPTATGPGNPVVPESWPRIEGYKILGVLGQGGTGMVYRARQIELDRDVAVKMLIVGGGSSAQDAEHLLQDARTASKLQHLHIVPVYGVGEHQGRPFFVMELIPGGNLAEKLPQLLQTPRVAARLVVQAAQALDYAHHEGVCHRDVKPANIMLRVRHRVGAQWESSLRTADARISPALEDLDACVTDFGLAKRSRADAGLTRDGTVVGTPGYMAPEQIRSEKPSPAADVYGLGAVLYECLTGRPPFRGATSFDTLLLTLQTEVVRPRVLNSRLPRDLETVCLKALEKEPSRRYPSAAELAADLERWLDGKPVRARPVGPLDRGWRWCRRSPVIAGLLAALALTMSCGLVASLLMWRKAVDNEARARAGEGQAQASLRQEEEARRDAEDQNAMLRATMDYSILSSSSSVFTTPQTNPTRQAMLRAAESALHRLLARQPDDAQLRVMLAKVLTQSGALYYAQHQNGECIAAFERAADLWGQVRDEEPRMPQNRAWCAIVYVCLEQAYERAGRHEYAQQSFEIAVRLWQGLIKDNPNEIGQNYLFPAAVNMRWLLADSTYVEAEAPLRFQKIRERLERMGGGEECAVFYGLLRLAYLWPQAELCIQTGHKEGLLVAAREASTVLADILPRASLPKCYRVYSAYHSLRVSLWLRRVQVPEEALRLSVLANGALRELVRDAPRDLLLLTALSGSWHELGKIYWELGQVEETLTAGRNAIEAQRKASALAPSAEHTLELGRRYMQLGRKLCELGRLDEAEVCFSDRQALWPGDSGKHDEALRELRKWAAEVEVSTTRSLPGAQEKRNCYLELCSRLERKGAGTTSVPALRP